MESRQKKRLGDMLIEEQIITDEQLSDELEKKKGTTKRLGEVLVELGYTSETDIAKALSSQLGLEIVSPSGRRGSSEKICHGTNWLFTE